MSDELTKAIWRAADKARGKVPADDLLGQVDAIRKEGIEITPRALEHLLQRRPREAHVYFPVHLAEFVADVVAPYGPESVLDP